MYYQHRYNRLDVCVCVWVFAWLRLHFQPWCKGSGKNQGGVPKEQTQVLAPPIQTHTHIALTPILRVEPPTPMEKNEGGKS